jgi:UDP-N-acetylglucosamine 2-epimerase (non-hydrolysing)
MKIVHTVGARPNFMKAAPVIEALDQHNRTADASRRVEQILVHTGQHYDRRMSSLFFDELGLPRPDVDLGVGSGPHGQQTGRVMEAFEKVLEKERPDLVIVVGDVNSTVACAIDAKKLGIPVAHIEAGLRSRDMTMPEEINRIVTDSIADLLFTTDRGACRNLEREGVAPDRIHFVGNVMIDTLMKHRERALAMPTLQDLGLTGPSGAASYVLVTLHRPGNVDSPETLAEIGEALSEIGRTTTIVFPVHPRTRASIERFGLGRIFGERAGVRLLDPLGYLDFLNLQANARMTITDSGGIQEESTILGVPCLTLRPNTERPITVEQGTNRLVTAEKTAILAAFGESLGAGRTERRVPELWDGRSASRIVDVLVPWCFDRAARG